VTPPVRSSSPLPRARKRFGQHFLERAWTEKVIATIDPKPEEVFLEIGPGRGALTLPLLQRARHVIAFEVDRDLAASLRCENNPKLTVVEGDFLEVTADRIRESLGPVGLAQAKLRVAGNLPYNVASPIMFKVLELFEADTPVEDATFMLQREVADRILASPGTSEYGVLSVLLGQVAEVSRLLALPPGAFRPPPKVHSSLLRLRWHRPSPAPLDLALFRALVRSVFTRRRKTLSNALLAHQLPAGTSAPTLAAEAGLDPRQRPGTLDIAAFVRLADAVAGASR
jgi:16S rRNA (adenine1518-N6/adenine1519-N6)-dimethyltransferase